MNEYEILLMLDADLAEERQNEILTRIRELVESGGGTWVRHDPWGRRKLAYEIAKKTDGVYHLLLFDATPATLAELSRMLKITDGVIRHLAVRRVQGPVMAPAGSRPPCPLPGPIRRHEARGVRARRPVRTEEEQEWQHQPRRSRRQPDARPRASAHAERHGRLLACGSP